MHLDSQSVNTLGVLRQADIRREFQQERLARQARQGQNTKPRPAWWTVRRWTTALRGLAASPTGQPAA
jgi:hypothetical protein